MLQLTLYIVITHDKRQLPMSILKACYYLFFCCLVRFFKWTVEAQPHFWLRHACLNQAFKARSDPRSEREDAYSLTRGNYQERLEPLILGINCQAENQIQKCLWGTWLSMTAAFLFQTTGRTLQFTFFILCIFLMLWLNTAAPRALIVADLLQELVGGSGVMEAIRRCAALWWRAGKWKMRFPCLEKSLTNFQTLLYFVCFITCPMLWKTALQRTKVITGETRVRCSISHGRLTQTDLLVFLEFDCSMFKHLGRVTVHPVEMTTSPNHRDRGRMSF